MYTADLAAKSLSRRHCVAGLLCTSALVSGCANKSPELPPIVLPPPKPVQITPPDIRGEVDQFLRAKKLSWSDLARKHIEAEAVARKCARQIFKSSVEAARQNMLDEIETDFVNPYFSWFNQNKQSFLCGVMWFVGKGRKCREDDFESAFRGINEKPMMAAWHKSVDLTLAEYAKQQQLNIRYFYYSQIGLTEQQFSKIMATINVNPTGAAKTYAEKLRLFDNKLSEVLSSGRDLCDYAKDIGELVSKVAKHNAQSVVAESAANRMAGGCVYKVAERMGIKLTAEAAARIAARAMVVVGILVEGIFQYWDYLNRQEQRRKWMEFFRGNIAQEESRFFEAALGHAYDASLNKDIVTALNLAGTSRSA